MNAPSWPYPRWIAHRGGGQLAPENTLAALRTGAAHGFQMAECDVKLSADGVPFLLHDDTLNRTTNGQGPASARHWSDLTALDAGAWHSPAFASERLPTLEAVAHWCQAQHVRLNIEIKPCPGREALTGRTVALAAQRLWATYPVPPLLTSFQPDSLAAAQASAPALPRGLLIDRWWPGWETLALRLGCVALVAEHNLWSGETVALAKKLGLRTLAYTVNDLREAQCLMALGVDGLITDRMDAPTHG